MQPVGGIAQNGVSLNEAKDLILMQKEFLAICLCLVLASCGRNAPQKSAPALSNRPPVVETRVDPALLSGARALERAGRFVGVSPRYSGTDGAKRAAEFLVAELKSIGLETELDEFEDDALGGKMVFRNVVGRIPGRGKGLIVLGSHYDTKVGIAPDFKGANDSGSSTGLLLELASVLRGGRGLGVDIEVVFFDGEECFSRYGPQDGLHGSRRFARRLQERGVTNDVRGVLVLDMIGDSNLSVRIPRNSSPGLCTAVFDAAREEGVRSKFGLFSGAMVDDHVPFLAAGMPAIDIIDFEYGSAPGLNDYWHTPQDTMDKLDAGSLETVGRVVIRVLNSLGNR